MFPDIINKQAFEFTCESEDTARVVQRDFELYTAVQFNKIMAAIFAEVGERKGYLKIDKLEIDLGDIIADGRGKEQMLTRFREDLINKIADVENTGAVLKNEYKSLPAVIQNELEMIRIFMTTGDLPWWVDKNNGPGIESVIQKLAVRYPEALKHLLEDHMDTPEFLSRLSSKIKPATFLKIGKLVPGFSKASLTDKYVTESMHIKVNAFSREQVKRIKKILAAHTQHSFDQPKKLLAKLLMQLNKQVITNKISIGGTTLQKLLIQFNLETLILAAPAYSFIKQGQKKKEIAAQLDRLGIFEAEFLIFELSRLPGTTTYAPDKSRSDPDVQHTEFLAGSTGNEKTPQDLSPDISSEGEFSAVKSTRVFGEGIENKTAATSDIKKLNTGDAESGTIPNKLPGKEKTGAGDKGNIFDSGNDELNTGLVKAIDPPTGQSGSDKQELSSGHNEFKDSDEQESIDIKNTIAGLQNDTPGIFDAPLEDDRTDKKQDPVLSSLVSKNIEGLSEETPVRNRFRDEEHIEGGTRESIPARPEQNALSSTDGDPETDTDPAHGSDAVIGSHNFAEPAGTIDAENKSATAGDLTNEPFAPGDNPAGGEDQKAALQQARIPDQLSEKMIGFIIKKLKNPDVSLLLHLQQLDKKQLAQLAGIFRKREVQNKENKELIKELLETPSFLRYNLVKVFAGFTFRAEPHTGKKNTDKLTGDNYPQNNNMPEALRLLPAAFISAIKKLPAADLFTIKSILEKGRFDTDSEKSVMKKMLLKLPHSNILLLKFLTELTSQELDHLVPPVSDKEIRAQENKKRALYYTEKKQENIYIENAGLCLLAIYLPGFFGQLNYLENAKFRNDSFALRAVCLLEYIVSGETNHPEYLLQFNKLLCSFKIEDQIINKIRLTKKEKAEADSLVSAVVGNWNALKSTSVQGFRESFLKRKGILFEKESGWVLRVEKKGFDILLDSLPWSFGIIKLPWMKKMIHVEW